MKYSLIIFDADGTLRQCTVPNQPCPNKPGEWELLPGVKEVLTRLFPSYLTYGIASNQAGVGYGYMTEEVAYGLLLDTVEEIFGSIEVAIQMCPHTKEDACECRKPKPGMLQAIMQSQQVQPHRTLFIGDMESDKQAAENAGCDFMWAEDFFRWDNNADFLS